MVFQIKDFASGQLLCTRTQLPTPKVIKKLALLYGKHLGVYCSNVKIYDTRWYLPTLKQGGAYGYTE